VSRSSPRRDPRDEAIVEADVIGLLILALLQCLTQPQLRKWCYPGRKESNVSRRIHRWLRLGLVGVERFLGMGCNLLFITERGVDALVDGGHARRSELFPRNRPIAAKDLSHHLYIADAALLAKRGVPMADPEKVEPAWLLQRRHVPAPAAVPDLLVTSAPNASGRKSLIAYEVDLATESKKVFVEKLGKLAKVLLEWSAGGKPSVIILTRGSGRKAALEQAVAKLPVPMLVKLLPKGGPNSMEALAKVLSRGGKSGEGDRPQVAGEATQSQEVTESADPRLLGKGEGER
jgi:hypothetical protein